MQSVRLGRSVADNVEAQFTTRRFICVIHFTDRRFDHFGDFRHHRPLWQVFQRLSDDFGAFTNFQHPHQVALPVVTDAAGRHRELEPVVNTIRFFDPQVIVNSRGAQNRSGHALRNQTADRHDRNTFQPGLENFVAIDQVVVLGKHPRQISEEFSQQFDEFRRNVIHHAADSHVRIGQARTGGQIEQVQDVFAVAERVHHAAHTAQVQRRGTDEQHVAGDTVQFSHDDPDILGPFRHFRANQFFYRLAVGQVVAHRGNIIQSVRIGNKLGISPGFGQFLQAAVQIAHHRCCLNHGFAIELQQYP